MEIKGKKVVVTGVAGLVGSRLAARLLEQGNTVIGIDNLAYGNREVIPAGVDFREGHTKDIAKLIPEKDIEIIFHLAEYARVEQSLEEPDVVFDLNKIGTFGVVEWWRARKNKLVYAGSSTKFGDGGLARDATPYAWTKATNTELVKNYGAWYNLPYAITYFYNVYGPGERSGKYGTVIQIFKDQYVRGEQITVTSPGTQRRNFTHVDDIVDGLIAVAEKGEGDNYGLGNEKTFSILEVAQLFGLEVSMLPDRPGNRASAELDTSKANAIGWKATRLLEADIEQFLKEHPRKK